MRVCGRWGIILWGYFLAAWTQPGVILRLFSNMEWIKYLAMDRSGFRLSGAWSLHTGGVEGVRRRQGGDRDHIRKQIQNYRYKAEYEYLFRMKKKSQEMTNFEKLTCHKHHKIQKKNILLLLIHCLPYCYSIFFLYSFLTLSSLKKGLCYLHLHKILFKYWFIDWLIKRTKAQQTEVIGADWSKWQIWIIKFLKLQEFQIFFNIYWYYCPRQN